MNIDQLMENNEKFLDLDDLTPIPIDESIYSIP
jgi:hypothetical protein